jgi:hypothetical protein
MGAHEEFLALCAAATAGELGVDEQASLEAHLAVCADCRRVRREYETAARVAVAAFAQDVAAQDEAVDSSWSVQDAEQAFFKRLNREQESKPKGSSVFDQTKLGKRFTYRRSEIRWREIWMPLAAAVLLALALGIAAYRTGVERGIDAKRTAPPAAKQSTSSLEEQSSDMGHERAQLLSKLEDNARLIADLKRQLAEQLEVVNGLKSTGLPVPKAGSPQSGQNGTDTSAERDGELAAAQAKLADLQKTLDTAYSQHDEAASRAAAMEAKIGELTQLVRDREQALDQKQAEVAKDQELLEHDRDIRELMGARQLYMADVRDVSGAGTDKTYGRLFYTKGKSLIFYAFDLDAHPGVQNASSFQAWGRRGPDKEQALNLGIFYEDNVSKKRWVLKADDPKTLQDIDAVFVTVEPNGGSHHPSGKQLLFAYLRVGANHP